MELEDTVVKVGVDKLSELEDVLLDKLVLVDDDEVLVVGVELELDELEEVRHRARRSPVWSRDARTRR